MIVPFSLNKKIAVFSLLFCFLLDPIIGTFTYFYVKRTFIKIEVKNKISSGISRDKLVLLKFSVEESKKKLNWKHSREFEYNHNMYDVVEKKTIGDTVYYWCYYDHEEAELNRKIEKLIDRASNRSTKLITDLYYLMYFFKSLYCPLFFDLSFPTPQILGKKENQFSYLYSSIFISPSTPPP